MGLIGLAIYSERDESANQSPCPNVHEPGHNLWPGVPSPESKVKETFGVDKGYIFWGKYPGPAGRHPPNLFVGENQKNGVVVKKCECFL